METPTTETIMEVTETITEGTTVIMDTTRMAAMAVVTGTEGITTAATTRGDIIRTTPLSSADYRFRSLSRFRAFKRRQDTVKNALKARCLWATNAHPGFEAFFLLPAKKAFAPPRDHFILINKAELWLISSFEAP